MHVSKLDLNRLIILNKNKYSSRSFSSILKIVFKTLLRDSRKRGTGKERKRMKGILSLSKFKKTRRSTKKKNRNKLMDTVHDNYSKYIYYTYIYGQLSQG